MHLARTSPLTSTRRMVLRGGLAAGGLAALIPHNGWADMPASIPIAGHLPDLQFSMEDAETGQPVTAAAFQDHPVILYFGFTRCPDTCPLTMQNAARLVHRLGKQAAGLRILFVTIDPDYDTAARLKTFLAQFGAPPIFTGLRGTPDQLRRLAARYGVYYKAPSGPNSPDPVSAVGHSDATYLFGPTGKAVAILPTLPTARPKLPQLATLLRPLLKTA